MFGLLRVHGKMIYVYKTVIKTPEEERPSGKTRCSWAGCNTKLDPKEIL
jgi:hypothetical protein